MLLAIAFGLIVLGLIVLFFPVGGETVNPLKRVITLEELSGLWKGQGKSNLGPCIGRHPNGKPADKAAEGADELSDDKAQHTDHRGWDNEGINSFYTKHVVPWQKLLESQSALIAIEKVLEILDTHGGCPSIVTTNQDQETKDLHRHWTVLARVTLADHTLRVTNIMVDYYDSNYKDHILRGAYILAGLSHDLGKIPKFRDKSYSLGDHPVISVRILGEIASKDIPYLDQVSLAVRNHHFAKPQNELTRHLQEADKRAREQELILFGGALIQNGADSDSLTITSYESGRKVIPSRMNGDKRGGTAEWLMTNIGEILCRVLPLINQPTGFGKWKAFSMSNGICYIEPELLLEKTREFMKEKNITDLTFTDDSLKEKAKIHIADALGEKGWLCEGVKEGYYGAYWNYELRGQMRKGYWTPVIADAFGIMPNELETRKKFPLKAVKNVELCMDTKENTEAREL